MGLLLTLAAALAAFWVLLGYCYSPERYTSWPAFMGITELTWLSLGIIGTVYAAVMLFRHEQATRDWVTAALPLAAYSCFILVKTAGGRSIRFYDMILFSTVLGWAAARCARKRAPQLVNNPMPDPVWMKRAIAAVWVIGSLLALYFYFQQTRYLKELALGYPDCGEAARLMFNTLCNPGELFLRVNPHKPIFYDHFQPGILPLIPLWLLWPDLKLTIVLQIIAFVGCAAPIYWLGKQTLKDQTAGLLLALCWLAYPSVSQMIYSGTYGFRWGNLCLLLYFIALVFWLKDHRGWALAAIIWALLIKEEAAIILGMFGVYLALFERRRQPGLLLAAIAVSYFILVTSVIIPKMSSGAYMEQGQFFGQLGATKWQILLSPVTKPHAFWGRLLEWQSFGLAAALLAPLLFLPLRKPSVLFIGSLTFLVICLSHFLKNLCFHYQAGLLPVIFWALCCALQDMELPHRRSLLLGALTSTVMLSLFLGNTFWSKMTVPIRIFPGRLAIVETIKQQIDPNRSLFATKRVAAHFVTQKYLYVDPPVPTSIDYVLLDLRDSWRTITSLSWLADLRAIQRQAETNSALHLVAAEDGIVLYARQGKPLNARALVERESLPPDAVEEDLHLGEGARMSGFTVRLVPSDTKGGMQRLIVTTYCSVDRPTRADFAVQCILRLSDSAGRSENYVSEIQPLGQGIWPIEHWIPGKLYEDPFILQVGPDATLEHLSVAFESLNLLP